MPVSDDGYVHTMYADHITNSLRDINGELDVSNETCSRENFTLMKCKYTDKVCLCLGVSMVTTGIDGVEKPQEGRRWTYFDYSGKMLLIMADFEKKVQCKIARVKCLKGEKKFVWVKFPVNTEDKFYLDDPIT